MSKRQTLMLFGVIIISFLFLGFPALWDKFIAIFSGLVIIFIALKLKPETSRSKKLSYAEHKNGNSSDVHQDTSPGAHNFDISRPNSQVSS